MGRQLTRNQKLYQETAFEPIQTESVDKSARIIEGKFPPELNGMYVLNGPNPTSQQLSTGYHVFDGHGMLRIAHFQNGHATLSQKWIPTRGFKFSQSHKISSSLQIGELNGINGLLKAAFVYPTLHALLNVHSLHHGPANTALLHYDKKLYALHEGSLPFRLQLQSTSSFEPLGFDDFGGVLDFPFAAHTKVDPTDGCAYFLGYHPMKSNEPYKLGKLCGDRVESYFPVHSGSGKISFAHDFVITKNYILLLENSVVFNFKDIVKGRLLQFDQNQPFRVGVLPKNATDDRYLQWFTFDRPLAVVHTLNGWDDDGGKITFCAPAATDFDLNEPFANRFVTAEFGIDLNTNKTSFKWFNGNWGRSVEFPVIHPQFIGRKSQYGYALVFQQDRRILCPQLVKIDMFDRRICKSIDLPSNVTGFEPIVIPKRRGMTKRMTSDHAYIALMALNMETEEAEWLVYDAGSFNKKPVLRLAFDKTRVSMGFHGIWIPQNELQEHLDQQQ